MTNVTSPSSTREHQLVHNNHPQEERTFTDKALIAGGTGLTYFMAGLLAVPYFGTEYLAPLHHRIFKTASVEESKDGWTFHILFPGYPILRAMNNELDKTCKACADASSH